MENKQVKDNLINLNNPLKSNVNLFSIPPLSMDEELITILAKSQNTRVERIISTGQTSQWYEQEEHEFVSLLQGEAGLTFENGEEVRLICGDTLLLPSGKRHRVSYTSQNPPCIWLCFFWK